MRVEIINTGSEILLGRVVNTHLAALAEGLFPLGLRVERQITVPDGEAIAEALDAALQRAEIIFVTGGLGPTTDDLTRELTAARLGLRLQHDARVMDAITERFARRGIPMSDRVARQAQVPEGAIVLPNPNGTAPGLYLRHEGRHLFLLPGPPRELNPMFRDAVLPMLRQIVPNGDVNEQRIWHILGLGESNVEAAVGPQLLAIPGLELGYCARPGEVDVRCIGPRAALEAAEAILLAAMGRHIVTRDGVHLEEAIVQALAARGETLSVAESCTGGNIAHRLTNVPGASAVLAAGFVTYANEAKTRDLGVPAALMAEHGAVSAPVAVAMAEGALQRAGTDWALSATGIAGPGGGTEKKPVGTVFLALARRNGPAQVEEHHFPREREVFKDLAARTALAMLSHCVALERG